MFCKYVCVSVNVYACMNVSCCWRCVIESFITCGLGDAYGRKKLSIFFGKPVETFFTKETHMLAKYESCVALNSKDIFVFGFCLVELLLGICFYGI